MIADFIAQDRQGAAPDPGRGQGERGLLQCWWTWTSSVSALHGGPDRFDPFRIVRNASTG